MDEGYKKKMGDFLTHRHGLMAFIVSMVRDRHLAEDLFQELWIRFSEALEEGVEIRNVPKWCRVTVRNLALHHWRKGRQRLEMVNSEFLDRLEIAFAEQEERQGYWAARYLALAECLKKLPAQGKTVLDLKYGQGLKAEEIARRLDKTPAAVLMALSRIRRLLADCVTKITGESSV